MNSYILKHKDSDLPAHANFRTNDAKLRNSIIKHCRPPRPPAAPPSPPNTPRLRSTTAYRSPSCNRYTAPSNQHVDSSESIHQKSSYPITSGCAPFHYRNVHSSVESDDPWTHSSTKGDILVSGPHNRDYRTRAASVSWLGAATFRLEGDARVGTAAIIVTPWATSRLLEGHTIVDPTELIVIADTATPAVTPDVASPLTVKHLSEVLNTVGGDRGTATETAEIPVNYYRTNTRHSTTGRMPPAAAATEPDGDAAEVAHECQKPGPCQGQWNARGA